MSVTFDSLGLVMKFDELFNEITIFNEFSKSKKNKDLYLGSSRIRLSFFDELLNEYSNICEKFGIPYLDLENIEEILLEEMLMCYYFTICKHDVDNFDYYMLDELFSTMSDRKNKFKNTLNLFFEINHKKDELLYQIENYKLPDSHIDYREKSKYLDFILSFDTNLERFSKVDSNYTSFNYFPIRHFCYFSYHVGHLLPSGSFNLLSVMNISIIKFIELEEKIKIFESTNSIEPNEFEYNVEPYRFAKRNYPKSLFKKLFKALIEFEFIEANTSELNFLLMFSNEKISEMKRIVWIVEKNKLEYLFYFLKIKKILDKDKIWACTMRFFIIRTKDSKLKDVIIKAKKDLDSFMMQKEMMLFFKGLGLEK